MYRSLSYIRRVALLNARLARDARSCVPLRGLVHISSNMTENDNTRQLHHTISDTSSSNNMIPFKTKTEEFYMVAQFQDNKSTIALAEWLFEVRWKIPPSSFVSLCQTLSDMGLLHSSFAEIFTRTVVSHIHSMVDLSSEEEEVKNGGKKKHDVKNSKKKRKPKKKEFGNKKYTIDVIELKETILTYINDTGRILTSIELDCINNIFIGAEEIIDKENNAVVDEHGQLQINESVKFNINDMITILKLSKNHCELYEDKDSMNLFFKYMFHKNDIFEYASFNDMLIIFSYASNLTEKCQPDNILLDLAVPINNHISKNMKKVKIEYLHPIIQLTNILMSSNVLSYYMKHQKNINIRQLYSHVWYMTVLLCSSKAVYGINKIELMTSGTLLFEEGVSRNLFIYDKKEYTKQWKSCWEAIRKSLSIKLLDKMTINNIIDTLYLCANTTIVSDNLQVQWSNKGGMNQFPILDESVCNKIIEELNNVQISGSQLAKLLFSVTILEKPDKLNNSDDTECILTNYLCEKVTEVYVHPTKNIYLGYKPEDIVMLMQVQKSLDILFDSDVVKKWMTFFVNNIENCTLTEQLNMAESLLNWEEFRPEYEEIYLLIRMSMIEFNGFKKLPSAQELIKLARIAMNPQPKIDHQFLKEIVKHVIKHGEKINFLQFSKLTWILKGLPPPPKYLDICKRRALYDLEISDKDGEFSMLQFMAHSQLAKTFSSLSVPYTQVAAQFASLIVKHFYDIKLTKFKFKQSILTLAHSLAQSGKFPLDFFSLFLKHLNQWISNNDTKWIHTGYQHMIQEILLSLALELQPNDVHILKKRDILIKDIRNKVLTLFEHVEKDNYASMHQAELFDVVEEFHMKCELEYPINEKPISGLYIVDIAIPEKKIAIEFQGPTHFTRTTALNGASLMRHRHLTAVGWTVIHIPWWEWRELEGKPELQKQYIWGLLTSALESQDIEKERMERMKSEPKKTIRAAKKEMERVFDMQRQKWKAKAMNTNEYKTQKSDWNEGYNRKLVKEIAWNLFRPAYDEMGDEALIKSSSSGNMLSRIIANNKNEYDDDDEQE